MTVQVTETILDYGSVFQKLTELSIEQSVYMYVNIEEKPNEYMLYDEI